MSPQEAKEKLRLLCLEAWDVAAEQGWDGRISSRPHGREGYAFEVNTDRVDEKRLQERRKREQQLTLEANR